MTEDTNIPFDVNDKEQLGDYRYRVAGVIRDLLAARFHHDPKSMSEKVKTSWFPPTIQMSNASQTTLLDTAADNYKETSTKYGGYLDSNPYFEEDGTDPESQFLSLRALVIEFADFETLKQAARDSRFGEPINWARLARWDLLEEIRERLDQLPDCPKKPVLKTVQPNTVQFMDRACEDVRELIWNLLDYLLRCKNQTASVKDLPSEVWKDHALDVEEKKGALKSLLRDTRKFFRENQLPFDIRYKHQHVSLIASAPSMISPDAEGDLLIESRSP